MTVADEKAVARKAAFAARKLAHELSPGGASGVLSSVLAGYRGVPLGGYMPIRSEIDPRPAMAEASAHGCVGVPVIAASEAPLMFSRWNPETKMRDGPFGAQVPEADDFFEPEILIVPLVAFTRAGLRLGYGGGFYDRTLDMLRGRRATLAIGFAYSAQEMTELPSEPTDQLLDMIVTESEVIDI